LRRFPIYSNKQGTKKHGGSEQLPAKASEMIYTTDESGNLLELESRELLHLAKSSKRHAAVIGMILRSDGRLLLQWRAANKLGGSRLDVSATTHVRKSETFESALQRSFQNELRISKLPLRHAFDFTYVEELGDHKENEYCKVYIGTYDGKYIPNPDEIDSVEFMSLKELKEFVANKEKDATKWLRETANRLEPSMLAP
jgi:isopentenyl-diphosphate Delta-isomerase